MVAIKNQFYQQISKEDFRNIQKLILDGPVTNDMSYINIMQRTIDISQEVYNDGSKSRNNPQNWKMFFGPTKVSLGFWFSQKYNNSQIKYF
jgi:hypothetical protein